MDHFITGSITAQLIASCFPFISGSMMVELEDKISQLESWTDGKGLILHGSGGTFCSGSDLNAVRAISNPQVEKAEKFFTACLCCGYTSLRLFLTLSK